MQTSSESAEHCPGLPVEADRPDKKSGRQNRSWTCWLDPSLETMCFLPAFGQVHSVGAQTSEEGSMRKVRAQVCGDPRSETQARINWYSPRRFGGGLCGAARDSERRPGATSLANFPCTQVRRCCTESQFAEGSQEMRGFPPPG